MKKDLLTHYLRRIRAGLSPTIIRFRNAHRKPVRSKRTYLSLPLFLGVLFFAILFVRGSFAQQAQLEANKAIVRKVFDDILTRGNYDVANEIYAKDFINHTASKDVPLEQDQASARGWRAAFPDLRMTIEKEIAEGDFVTVLWKGHGTNTGSGNGLTATGKSADGRGISIFRIVGGKINEEWTEYDQLILFRQLGLLPANADKTR